MPTTIHLVAYNLYVCNEEDDKGKVCIGRGRMHLNMSSAHIKPWNALEEITYLALWNHLWVRISINMRLNQSIESFTFCFHRFPFKNKSEDAGTEQSKAAFSLTRMHIVAEEMRFSCFLLICKHAATVRVYVAAQFFFVHQPPHFTPKFCFHFQFDYALMDWKWIRWNAIKVKKIIFRLERKCIIRLESV